MNDIEPMTPEALSQYISEYIGKEWAGYFEQLQEHVRSQSIVIDQMTLLFTALDTECEALREAGRGLANALETCHICKGLVIVEDAPIHCEDCSGDCDDHEVPECETVSVLHRKLGRVLSRPPEYWAQKVKEEK